jgi:adenosylmethionine---8-amino-7-oxononanoate aminotransferase
MNEKEIVRLDRQHVWHPCTQEKDHETLPPIPIARGDGCYLVTVDGKHIIDAVSSWWVNLFGHNHPRLNRALQEQSQRIAHHIFAGFTHEPAVELARRLCDKAPGNLTRVFFADNGSAAVEVALKMSFQYWQQSGKSRKTRFVSISEAYHGETLGALAVSGCDLYRDTYRPILMQGFSVQGPDCFNCPYGLERDTCSAECFAPMEEAVTAHHEEIAGVIIEPLIQAAAGMRIYSPVYLQKLRALCDRYQVHYIADEIAVGFGRTGRLFANELAGTAPDILCLSKGITGGYLPLSVTLTTDEIYGAFYDDYETLKAFLHSHSYTGNPLACAVAVEVMKIFEEEDVLGQMKPRMALLEEARARFSAHPHVGEMRRCGLVGAIEMVTDKETRAGYPWQQRRGFQLYQKALKRGVLLRPLGNVVYFMPPLNIPLGALEQVVEVAWDCLNEVTREP